MKPFTPQRLPIEGVRWEPLLPLIGRANRAIAKFDGVLSTLQGPHVLLSPLTTQEAVLSSRIEGTRASLSEVLKHDAGQEAAGEEKRLDIQEIVNYRQALLTAEVELEKRPFCLNLILKLHGVLLDSVRGKAKAPGSFRRTQNWIGPLGSTIENARFVPPAPQHLNECLDNWEKYWHIADPPDALVQLAVAHAQFEILHPFLDGNGRVGRMLIPLFLYEKKLLSQPVFYLSGYLERHKKDYEDGLHALTDPDRWNAWIEFFLNAMISQAEENSKKARQILELYDSMKKDALALTHSRFAIPLLDRLFKDPIFRSSSLLGQPGMPSKPMIMQMLGRLKKSGMLKVLREGSGRRPQILVLKALVNLCEGKKFL